MRRAFGESVTATSGHVNEKMTIYGNTEVNGKWLEDTKKPVVRYRIDSISGETGIFVKVWGNRCNLDATEQLVKAITTSCACVGVDDKITIFVTEQGLEGSIIKLLVEKTGFNNRAFEVRVIDAIPVKSSGKIDYQAMQNMINQ